MSTAAPTIPPRPARSQQTAAARGANKLPEIPPRPIPKRLDRSVSPGNFPRSPLNEPFLSLSKTKSNDPSDEAALPRRPSVQHLPSVGQEGMEYADIDHQSGPPPQAPAEQTRSIAHDLKLHAPKPSLPKSSAAAQVQAVTRTDSSQAAAHGLGKPGTPGHDDHHEGDALGRVRSRASFSRPGSSASGGRRASLSHAEEQGPAELGIRVPINPLLGDVQAPSPAPFTPSHTGEKRRSHSRVKSRDGLPPGSYGLHGHGVPPKDPFERDWYAKHPEELQHEEAHGHGVYEGIGSGRGAFALSSDDLNKIVRDTASRGAGFGTSGNTVSYPDEQIGYMASAQYTSHTGNSLTKSLTNVSQPAVESPLRKSSVPAVDMDPIVSVNTNRSVSAASDHAIESPQRTPVHVDMPERRYNKITGGEETMHENEQQGAAISRPTTGQGEESDYSAPILAADEVAKESNGEFMLPAISPRLDRRSGEYEFRSGDATPTSRPGSRPGSIHGTHSGSYGLSRFISHHDERESMHTPLEDVDEYEPLFPDDENKQKELSHAERFKQRPDVMKHRFPSKDIWEDAPEYGMYQATVSTPDLTEPPPSRATATFETPEQEAAAKGERSEGDRRKLAQRAGLPSHLQSEISTRPGLQPRFPSQDIWEDSPESHHLVTTVSSPPIADDTSPVDTASKPMIPPRPTNKSKLAEGPSATQPAPVVPTRPAKKTSTESTQQSTETSPTELKKVPSLPDRPKPHVPPRPAKKPSGETLTKALSAESNETEKAAPVTSPPIAKAKPQVPARPGQSGKFASLKGNFMNDLNQKLGLGPPKEKEPEPQPEVEAKPLEDARKGRARGPQRRAPAKSPSAAPAATTGGKPTFSMYKPQSLWHISDDGLLNVGSVEALSQVEGTRGFSPNDEALPVDTEKAQQLQNATVADSSPPPTIDTASETKASSEASKRPEDAPAALAPSLATNAQGEYPDPTLGSPAEEKANPLSHQATNEEAFLSQHTTASSTAASGSELEREEPNPQTDAIPASKQTTSSTYTGTELERVETKAPEEPISLRDEQVRAPAPGPSEAVAQDNKTQALPTVTKEQAQISDTTSKSEHAAEPMPEQDVSYAQLEEMQRQADGKEPSDGGIAKVVE
ncbi:uncharacterized protein HMPREF1541_00579 [Cyphellophora europaea CBS 101466]|uniref:Altered inheritance of mitochondria protein 21 n=1 Tax=Cyphellophora europaea (strain CBS 101466) TaxID=1220924 RepID=W2SCR5_CYPE1|nr:uncharacterized protein HMPREF1541_00579 [Cyphellophora europaea CBS 101466]ETN46395.1 hypothetical protein HMPREF1541_00579 [Cyphellophora europaea CBS 101466]